MVLDGLAAAATGVCAANNWEANEVLTHLFVGARHNKAEQDFDRLLAAIDYKIERQKLHREDIRDLVELTTARMDIYHIVGTLLLTFCIAWYTDNGVLHNHLPIWFADLFLISNFAAVGYLILSVWLAMYAAIASRSIGTRLLTSFSRLSFPNRQQLSEIKAPIFFGDLRQYFKKDRIDSKRGGSMGVGGSSASSTGAGEAVSEDDQQHFRRFLQELPRWMSYDTTARVCMSYGMNQMLQALSYYVLGVIFRSSPTAAATSFVAVRLLSLLILWLDIGDLNKGCSDVMALLFLHFAPPALAGVLLYSTIDPSVLHHLAKNTTEDIYKARLSMLATLCFWGHAGWLAYIASLMARAGERKSRFKPGDFVNVLEWVENKAVREDFIQDLEFASEELQREIESITKSDLESGYVHDRSSTRLKSLRESVFRAREVLDARSEGHPAVEEALFHARNVLKLLEVWEKASQILAALEGLRQSKVQERLTEREIKTVESSYQAFLSLCRKHGLGLCCPRQELVRSRGEAYSALPLTEAETCFIILGSAESGQQTVWINAKTAEELAELTDVSARVTSYNETLNEDIPRWMSELASLSSMSSHAPTLSPRVEVAVAGGSGSRMVASREVDGGRAPGTWTGCMKTEVVHPPDELPVRLTWWFTIGTVLWWCIAGLAHAAIVLANSEEALQEIAEAEGMTGPLATTYKGVHTDLLQISWPSPARLFKVASLHCAESQVWMASKFNFYAAPSLPLLLQGGQNNAFSSTSRTLREIGDRLPRAVVCGGSSCDVLTQMADGNGHWSLAPLQSGTADADGNDGAEPVELPNSWRQVAGAWLDHDSETLRSPSAMVAAWDGDTVYAATLRWSNSTRAWAVHTSLELDPALGLCAKGVEGCNATRQATTKYDNVKSLQVTSDGDAILVMQDGGILDVWDMAEGVIRGRIHLDHEYTSMCQSDDNVLLVRQGATGPLLVSLALPADLAKLVRRTSAGAGHRTFGHTLRQEPANINASRHHSRGAIVSKFRKGERFLGAALIQFASSVTRLGTKSDEL